MSLVLAVILEDVMTKNKLGSRKQIREPNLIIQQKQQKIKCISAYH